MEFDSRLGWDTRGYTDCGNGLRSGIIMRAGHLFGNHATDHSNHAREEQVMKIITRGIGTTMFESQDCVGCRTCEIACSFHHKKTFSPSISSIAVQRGQKATSYTTSFYDCDLNGHLACDKCQGEDEPLCVKYCNVLARDELKTFLKEFLSKR